MFLREILDKFLITAPEKQELSSQQPLQVSTETGQQLELNSSHTFNTAVPSTDGVTSMWWIAFPPTKPAPTTKTNPKYHIASILTLL